MINNILNTFFKGILFNFVFNGGEKEEKEEKRKKKKLTMVILHID